VNNKPLTVFYCITLAITLFTLPAYAFQADSTAVGMINLSSSVDKTETPLNQPVNLTVTMTWEGRPNRYVIDPFEKPGLTNLEMTGSSTNSRSELRNGRLYTIKDFSFRLYPVEMGMAYIDEIVITYGDTTSGIYDRLVTQRLDVKVISPVYEADYGWVWRTVLGILVLGALAGGLTIGLKRRRGKKEDDEPPPKPPEDLALEEIANVTAGNSGSLKKPLDDMITVFRKFLVGKFAIPAGSRSDGAVVSFLEKEGCPDDLAGKVRAVFDRTGQLRFSGTDVTPDQLELIRGMIESCISGCRGIGGETAGVDN